MSEISIWSPINWHDFWLPGAFYTGNGYMVIQVLKEHATIFENRLIFQLPKS